MRVNSTPAPFLDQQLVLDGLPPPPSLDTSERSASQLREGRDAALLADVLRPRAARRTTRPSGPRLTWGWALAAAAGSACLIGVARAQTTTPPAPRSPPTQGVISNQGATFASWTFDDGFSAALLAFCKQVNPARGLLRKIQACGSNTVVAESPTGIFLGGIGKPSDCPDANTADVYTAALYVSNVIRNSTAYQCLKGLVQNPVLGP